MPPIREYKIFNVAETLPTDNPPVGFLYLYPHGGQWFSRNHLGEDSALTPVDFDGISSIPTWDAGTTYEKTTDVYVIHNDEIWKLNMNESTGDEPGVNPGVWIQISFSELYHPQNTDARLGRNVLTLSATGTQTIDMTTEARMPINFVLLNVGSTDSNYTFQTVQGTLRKRGQLFLLIPDSVTANITLESNSHQYVGDNPLVLTGGDYAEFECDVQGKTVLKSSNKLIPDDSFIPNSENPVQSQVIQAALDEKVDDDDERLSDSREWTADTVSQEEAEEGTETTRRAWTAQRVRQAIIAWWDNISIVISDITGLQTALDEKQDKTITSETKPTESETEVGSIWIHESSERRFYLYEGDNGKVWIQVPVDKGEELPFGIDDIFGLQGELDGKEDYLDNPLTDGQVLSSTTAGERSWVDLPSGSVVSPLTVEYYTDHKVYRTIAIHDTNVTTETRIQYFASGANEGFVEKKEIKNDLDETFKTIAYSYTDGKLTSTAVTENDYTTHNFTITNP